jgi:acyl-CoA synthetase (AMP-forming)/AMP-acid ligase II
MVIRSHHPDVVIPDAALTPFVLERAGELAEKPALIDGPSGRTITYAGLAGGVRKVAAGLAARGLAKGDVFGMFMPNLPEFPLAFHGIATAGGVVTTINSLYTADEVAFQLKDSGARFLLTVPPFLDRALDAAGRTGVEEVFVLGEAKSQIETQFETSVSVTPFASLLSNEGDAPEIHIDPREDLVVLPYSSGTTGFAKGVMLTHRNLVANLCQILAVHGTQESDRIIGVLPFFHIYGMIVVLNMALRQGATVVTMPRFDLEQFLQIMQDSSITRAYLVPPIVLALAKHPLVDGFDLSNLGLIMSGAAPLDATLAEACATRLGCRVIQGYGLTETSPVTHLTPDDDPTKNKPGSIGPPIPNTDVRVVDYATGGDCATGVDGEVWVRGPQVMRGYLNNPSATALTIDDEGWLHTGDIGHADEDGYFQIVDRLKELIKYKGYQVPPAELEAVLLTHEAIADAAVIPVPDEEAGEVPKAFVVLKAGAEVTTEEVMDFVATHVAPHKKVREVEFVAEIPKSASGKILRRVLVERERSARR